MRGCKGPRKRLGALVYSNLLAFSAADNVRGADLPPPAPPATEAPFPFSFHGFYVRFGVEGILNESSSNLYSQAVGGVTTPGGAFIPVGGVGPQLFLAGRGATYSNVLTASFQSGYFFTPNWSVEISGGVPIWVSLKINGFSAQPPVAGTVLAKILPGGIPITGVYHFTQFGPFQPYLGAGVFAELACSRAATASVREAGSSLSERSSCKPASTTCSPGIGASTSTSRRKPSRKRTGTANGTGSRAADRNHSGGPRPSRRAFIAMAVARDAGHLPILTIAVVQPGCKPYKKR